MRASNNGDVRTCVHNLLQIYRGEVPYERLKGLDTRLIDRPTEMVKADIKQDARWLIETYEPRAVVDSIDVSYDSEGAASGGLIITANLRGEGAVSNG